MFFKYISDHDQRNFPKTGQALIREEERLAQELEQAVKPAKDTASIKLPENKPEELYIQVDGAMVPICPKKGEQKGLQFRENKLAVLFDKKDLQPCSNACRSGLSYKITQKRFASSLGQGVKHFESLLRKRAFELGAQAAKGIVFLSDGALWIDAIRERLFPNSIHILDWYHAVENLYKCARSIFGESKHDKIKQWVEPLKELLWQGRALEVCDRLLFEASKHRKHETVIRELYGYYHSRLEKMKYAEFRQKGYFIGSGAVEALINILYKLVSSSLV